MTTILAIVVMLVLGAPAAWRLRMPGTAFLFGSGIVYLSMLASFRWWYLIALPLAAASLLVPSPRERGEGQGEGLHLLDLLTLVYLTAYAFYATAARPWHWDFWAIWGLKARVFAENTGIDWSFLQRNDFAHPDYPLLVPFNFAFLNTPWSDRWLGLYMLAFAASLALVARQLAARSLPPRFAAVAGFAVAALASSQYVGLAEVPLIAFGTAALILARDNENLAAALLLGFAAGCKNEGLSLLVAAMLLRWRLWPSILIALPWLILRTVHGLSLDLTAGDPLSRIARPWPVSLLATHLDKPWLWLAILAALPLTLRREKFLYGVVAIQLAFFLAAYAITPNDLAWHISTSWDRLSRQLLVPATYAALIALASKGAAVAETRSES